jgi:DNA-binding IclR family transcriptional regulator
MEHLASSRECGITDMANRTKVAKSTAHRLIRTLEQLGYAMQNPETGKYYLTFKVFHLGTEMIRGMGFGQQVACLLEELAVKCGLVVKMGVYDSRQVLCVYRSETARGLRMEIGVGSRIAAHSSALGKAILAYSPESRIKRFLRENTLTAFTRNTITDPQVFLTELASTRKRGYSLDRGENVIEMRCVGAPVFDHLGLVIAAVSVSGPVSWLRQDRILELGPEVIQAARAVSEHLGWSPQCLAATTHR